MCGIVAIYARTRTLPDDSAETATRMAEFQKHRGPDAMGVRLRHRCVMANARLSVLDPGPHSDQPFSRTEIGPHLSYNGEIFNYDELRRDLEAQGVELFTQSDTELVLAAYCKFGESFANRLHGQFAICIYDEAHDTLVLVRDRVGICPLYYVEHNGIVYVASNVRALIAFVKGVGWSIDAAAVDEYTIIRFALPPRTLVKQIRQVCPGEILTFQPDRQLRRRYWCLNNQAHVPSDPVEIAAQLRHIVSNSITRNCRSDATIGTFLSGGLDSSIVTMIAAERLGKSLATVSIEFNGAADTETTYACLMADVLGTKHSVCRPEFDHYSDMFDDTVRSMDHPTGSRDAPAIFALSRHLKARSPEPKVVLTGTGADELFNGYCGAYFNPVAGASTKDLCRKYLWSYSALNSSGRSAVRRIGAHPVDEDAVVNVVDQAIKAFSPMIDPADEANVLNAFYMVTHLVGWELAVNDSMCMKFSLEPRVPFLDTPVLEFAMSIPGSLKYREGREKVILRAAFESDLPKAIQERQKLPLSRSVARWAIAKGARGHISNFQFRDRGLFDLSFLTRLDPIEHFDVIWRALVLERWLQFYID